MEQLDNVTGYDEAVPPEKEWSVQRILSVTLFTLSFFLVVILNPLCLIVIRRVPNIQPSTKIFMASLTVSDFGMGVFVLLPYTLYVIVGYWAFGAFMCTLFRITKYFFFCQCLLSLLLLTIDRYIAIAWCLHYPRLVTVRRSTIAVVCCLFAVGSVSVFGNVFNESRKFSCGPGNERRALSFTLIGLALLGLAVTVILYAHILVIARRQARRIAQQTRPAVTGRLPNSPQTNTKSFTTVIIITGVVVVGWVPTIVCLLMVYHGMTLPNDIDYVVYALFYTCNWADAIIFYLRNKDFRETLHKMTAACLRTLRQTFGKS